MWGAQRQLHGGDSSGSAGGAPRGEVGGRRGAWRRDGGRDRRCQWAAGAASSTALHAAAESPRSPPAGERYRETPCRATPEPPVWGQALSSVPCLPTTLRCQPALTSPSRVSMVLIITVFLVCTSEPRCSGLVSAGGGHRGWDHRDMWYRGTAMGLGSPRSFSSLGSTPLSSQPHTRGSVWHLCVPQSASLATTPQEGGFAQKVGNPEDSSQSPLLME